MTRRLLTQLRLSSNGEVIGFDFPAAFQLASATGVNATAVAQFLPLIETAMVSKLKEKADVD